jgi:hypothetical protein
VAAGRGVRRDAGAPSPARRESGPAAIRAWLHRYESALWWLHSAWALAFGIGAVWLGARHFAVLRLAFVQVAFIWATSLLLRVVAERGTLGPRAHAWVRLVVNYLHKNFYQQVLFFVLPVYWASATPGSANLIFVGLVALAAVLSTLDIVYDRHVSVKRGLAAVYFAFSVFACVNVALPVLWSVNHVDAMRLSAGVALAGFVTLRFRRHDPQRLGSIAAIAGVAAGLLATVEWGRRFIPPAPLVVVSAEFGGGIDRRALAVTSRRERLTPAPQPVYVLTAIRAPLGLRDRVRHRWSVGGRTVRETPYSTVAGGRAAGFRLWSHARLDALSPGRDVQVDVETEGGQLIGRARIAVGHQ